MKRVLPKETILEIGPTSIIYSKGKNIINKSYLININKLKNNLKSIRYEEYFENIGKDVINEDLENNYIPPMSFIYFKEFAQKAKIPSPQEILDTYLNVFCERKDDNFIFKEKFIVSKQIEFKKEELATYICRRYNNLNRKLFFIASFSKIVFQNDDLEIKYEYNDEIYNKIDISIIYKNCLFLITLSENTYSIENNEKLINALEEKYEKVFIISTYTKDNNKFDKIDNLIYYNDDYINEIFENIKELYNNRNKTDNNDLDIIDTYLDFDKEPYYIRGLEDLLSF